MPRLLPLFPLQLVVFPGEDLNLHIFEPRYKQLVHEAEANGQSFGIPVYLNGKVQDVGTEVELVEVVKRYANGEMDIATKGKGLFLLDEFFPVMPNRLYPGGEIRPLAVDVVEDVAMNIEILDLVGELFRLLNIRRQVPDIVDGFLLYEVAHHIGLKLEQEYELLCLYRPEERQLFVKAHLEALLPMVKDMEQLRVKAQLNGHFKNMTPPL